MKQFVLSAFIMLGCLLAPWQASASSFVLTHNVITVEPGQLFNLPVFIDPDNVPSYTARLALEFSPAVLEVTRFTFSPNWLAVPQPGYDSIDNNNGKLLKTAGYPTGFFATQPFGTVTFRPKRAGTAVITVGASSLVLSADNQSTLAARPQVRVIVTGQDQPPLGEEADLTPLPDLPPEEVNLFDISLTPQIQTSGAGLTSKVAPGEFLPLSVKLLNFGSPKRVDVTIEYQITDEGGTVIYQAEETVAVETTATFVKTIQVPFETVPGRYVARSSISYAGQVVPATTEFPFVVERKILGLFQSDFLRYGSVTLLIALAALILGHAFIRYRARSRLAPIDYSDIPRDKRVFYELISDTVMSMRQRVGDAALQIAVHTPGLDFDEDTGRVRELTDRPSKVIADLVYRYETYLGEKVSFSFRKS